MMGSEHRWARLSSLHLTGAGHCWMGRDTDDGWADVFSYTTATKRRPALILIGKTVVLPKRQLNML
jgi:hypothetical protein